MFTCKTCEALRDHINLLERELELERAEKKALLAIVLPKDQKPEEQSSVPIDVIRPKYIPWRVRKEMLEQEDRQKAKLMLEKEKEEKDASQISEAI